MALVIRHPLPDEELGPFFNVAHCPYRWNCEQLYVGEAAGRLVALAIVFDGGHDVVMLDYIRVLPPWEHRGIWWRLTKHVLHEMERHGKRLLMGYVFPAQVAGMAQHLGGQVGPETYHLVWKHLPHTEPSHGT